MIRSHNPDFSKLLTYYQQEMAYLLQSGQLFAKAYPRVAQDLDFSHKGSADPHVQRLLESFAFLTARLQMGIEDEYSQFSAALLETLYPQFISPFPSCVMVQANLIPELAKKMAGAFIPPRTILTATSNDGQSCRFQTTMGETIWPLEVVDVAYDRVNNYDLPQAQRIRSPWLLKVRIRSQIGTFKGLAIEKLRFHLGGDILTAMTLFRWLHTYDPYEHIPVFIQSKPNVAPEILPTSGLKWVGFQEEAALIPTQLQLAPAYRLLLEYFMFPQKFLFIEIDTIAKALQNVSGDECTLYFALGVNAQPEKWPLVPQNMTFGCIPAVNLFFKTAEPIRLDQRKVEYRLVPDYRRENAMEIHTILKVSGAFDMETPAQVYEPYFSYSYKSRQNNQSAFWVKRRSRALNPQIQGTDVHLSFVDQNLNIATPAETTIYAHTLCTNRKFAEQVPVNTLLDVQGDFTGLRVVTTDRPTRSVIPPMDGETQWRLISHLSIDHLGVCTQTGSVEPLRELLRLYNLTQSTLSVAADSIQSLKYRQTVGRMGTEAWRGFAPLISVSILVDDMRANTQGFFLLSMILHELFKISASFNTLVETQMIGKSQNQVIKKWLPEACTAPLI